MSDEIKQEASAQSTVREVKWYDKKLLLRSVLVGLVFYGLFWGLAKRAEPPEGYVFPRLPVVSGIYKCCEAGGRYSKSWVGDIGINCSPIGYYDFVGTNRNDCGLKEELNQHPVEVIRATTPSFFERSPLVVQISSDGKTFYELHDKRLRELWISESHITAFALGCIFAVVFSGAQLIYLNSKQSKHQGEKV